MPAGPPLLTYRGHAAPPRFFVVGPLDPMQIWPGPARYPVNHMVSLGGTA